jgi:hypothetical protein
VSFKKLVDKHSASKEILGGSISINDLREKEFSGKLLSESEKLALANFDKFRISELNQQPDDLSFHQRYRELQIIANLGDYREFLDEKYSKLAQ